MHSTASDGTLSPSELVARLVEREINIFALTDHDTVGGLETLLASNIASEQGLELISGMELTADWNGRIVHIVGLNFDPKSSALKQYLASLEQLRIERAESIIDKLIKHKAVDDQFYARLRSNVDACAIGRPHIARQLVAEGKVASEQAAFDKYIGTGKVADVKMPWPSLELVVKAIRDAGGIAVIAHPTKYRFTFTKLRTLVEDFKRCGGEAIEVSYPGIKVGHQHDLERLARLQSLKVSAGSDFHSPSYAWTDVGKFAPVIDEQNHVLKTIL
jgi:predicted metal-dependent phosphoesterase TrpH